MDDGHTNMTFGHGATPTPESANDVVPQVKVDVGVFFSN